MPCAPIDPARLFSTLADPCPSRSLSATLEGFALEVRAMPAGAWAGAWWAAEAAPAEVRASRYTRELLARCLWSEDHSGEMRRALSVSDLGLLTDRELRDVSAEALATLDEIGPTYARSDWQSITATLEKGARHPLNRSTAVGLAACCDYGHGAVVFRPDRWTRCAMRDVTDGFWMAYRAARAAFADDDKPRSIAEAIRQAQAGRT